MIDIDELKLAAEAATPGPWRITHDNHDGWPLIMSGRKIVANVNLESFHGGVADFVEMPAEENARYFEAAQPSAILELVERVKAAERDARRWKEACENPDYAICALTDRGEWVTKDAIAGIDAEIGKESGNAT